MKVLLLLNGGQEYTRQAAAISDALSYVNISCVIWNEKRVGKCADKIRRGGFNAVLAFDSATASWLSSLKSSGGCSFETVLLCSDYCCTPKTARSGCDKYIIPHSELILEFVSKGVRDTRLLPFGIPTGLSERQAVKKQEARLKLGMDAEKCTVLYMCSGITVKQASSVIKTSVMLGKNDFQHVVLCDKKSVEKRLSYRFSSMPDVFTDSAGNAFDVYFDACDVIVTTPEPLTITVAAQLLKPVVLLCGSGMEARMNVRFFCDRGMAFSGRTYEDCVSYANRLCTSSRLRENMTESQKKYIISDAEKKTADYFASKIQA
jgi:processive 1,2-diacylglycerol beta-glucosyltransferase